MKTKTKLFTIMIAIACGFAGGTMIQASPAGAAGLVVKRSAGFGVNESVNLAIDGVEVAVLGINQSYRTALPAGKHILSITTNPKIYGEQSPDRITVNAKPGKTYTFTAVWGDSERASLVEQ
jgi:hypothetical protein